MKKTIFILTLLLPFGFLFAQVNDNYSTVYTHGNDNAESFISQLGIGLNESMVHQVGDENSVNVDQTNRYTKQYDRTWSNIRQQTANENTATVVQLVTVNRNLPAGGPLISEIIQNGDGNDALVNQRGLWLNANTLQNGNNGNAEQYQGSSKYRPQDKAYLSDANIIQRINVDQESLAEQHQTGWQNDADIDQNAYRSKAVQIQVNDKWDLTGHRGIDVNQAEIIQTGGGSNIAYQVQYYKVRAVPNVANAFQNGSGNYSEEVQFGGYNDSSVEQIGDGNAVNVLQNTQNVRVPGFAVPLPTNY
jgi:hypothetical protein